MSYFERTGGNSFRATEHVGGAWNTAEQHIAPAFGLLAHVVGCDRDARRDDGLVIGRLSYDILGVLPIGDMDVEVTVLRPGRTIELVEAVLSHGGRAAVRLRAWLMAPAPPTHSKLSATPDRLAGRDEALGRSEVWPGGFIESAEIRRDQVEPGRASFWARSPIPLLADEKVSDLAHAVRLFDISNGMTVRADPKTVAFPNLDLTAHLFRQPHGEWVGFDTTVSFGADGIGLTSSVLHDIYGPIGTMSQILTVRPGT